MVSNVRDTMYFHKLTSMEGILLEEFNSHPKQIAGNLLHNTVGDREVEAGHSLIFWDCTKIRLYWGNVSC